MVVTGERVTTASGGFNPAWQRHVAEYQLCAQFLPLGRNLDLGCGIGHSYELLAPRTSVGVDVDPDVLAGQARETHVADMRALPFADSSFDSMIAVQSLEHVPDPDRVLAESSCRVLVPEGVAVFVTPNRLTFSPPARSSTRTTTSSSRRTSCAPSANLASATSRYWGCSAPIATSRST